MQLCVTNYTQVNYPGFRLVSRTSVMNSIANGDCRSIAGIAVPKQFLPLWRLTSTHLITAREVSAAECAQLGDAPDDDHYRKTVNGRGTLICYIVERNKKIPFN